MTTNNRLVKEIHLYFTLTISDLDMCLMQKQGRQLAKLWAKQRQLMPVISKVHGHLGLLQLVKISL